MSHIKSFHLDYIEALRNDGHEVLIMANGEDADFDIPFEKKMLSFKNFSCISRIKRIIKEERFDVLVLNTTLAAFNIRLALRKKDRPKVINFMHGFMFPKGKKSLKEKIFFFAERFVAKKTDHIIVMNQEDLEITEKYKLCNGRVRMSLGMGASVHPAEMSVSEIRALMKCEDKFVITFVGEFRGVKNQRMLICALPEIKTTIPNAVLWLIGDGDMHRELSELASELSISDSVFFTGVRHNPCDFIKASDLYVSPSVHEGLPLNIMEALGCEKTVIATDIKGNRDLIENGVSGFLYDKTDISELIRLVRGVHSGELSLDTKNITNVYDKYSKTNVFPKTYAIIKELVEE